MKVKYIISVVLSALLIVLLSQPLMALDWWISGHGAILYAYEDGFKIKIIPIIDIRLDKIEPDWPWEIYFDWGRNIFEYEDINEDFYWMNFSASVRYKFDMAGVSPYIGMGPGLYVPAEGDNKFGMKFGLGVDYSINDRLALEVGSDFHNIFLGSKDKFNGDENFSFQTFQLGILFKLK